MSENYLSAISPNELERLGMQHQTWKPETDAFLRRSGFPDFKNIVEFGCGPGFSACDLAKEISPQAAVCGADISDLYLTHLNERIQREGLKNLRTVKANLSEPVDIGTDFDGAFCRWFLAWIRKDLDVVLTNIFRSLRPGGVFSCMEYLTLKSTVCSPPSAAFAHMVTVWEQFYIQCGATTDVGSLLPEALARAGFTIREMNCVGGFAPSGHKLYRWWKRLNEDFNEIFKQKGLLSTEQEQELKTFWAENSTNPNSFVFSPLLIQISAVKP